MSLFCANALRKPVEEVIMPAFTRATGQPVYIVFDSTARLLERVNAGAQPAVFVGLSGSLGNPEPPGSDAFHTARHIVRSGIGVAAAPDAKAPSITTVEELAFALTRCRSVAYSRTRPSGTYFHRMLEDLGIADIVNSRATFVEEGSTASALIDGRAVLAVQQISELKLVPEVNFLGPLPAAVQRYTEFSTYLCNKTADMYLATALFNFLSSSLARSAYAAAGLQAF
ncbi:substrate-binding domain-containing protein [Citricoccus nitrophenolicus]|uniref:substrate-binding domain-containing protein n=1 Tax=Citricoccus nitrophenolicus TaxID=863575 RepID=UPI0031EF7B66